MSHAPLPAAPAEAARPEGAVPTPKAADLIRRLARQRLPHLAAFSLAINLLALALPLFVLQVFDRVLASHSMATLAALAAGCLGALAVMAALELVRTRLLARAGQDLEQGLAPALVENGQADALADVERLRGFVSGAAMSALMDMPWTPLFVAVAFVVHPMIGWTVLGGAVLLLALAWAAERHLRAPHLVAAGAEARAERLAFCAGAGNAPLAEAWRRLRAPAWRARLDQADRASLWSGGARFLRFALQVLVIAQAAALAVAGEITAGAMIAALVLLGRALAPFERAQDLWRAVVAARVSLARLLRLPPAAKDLRPFVMAPEEDICLDVRNIACLPPGVAEPLFAGVRFKARAGDMIGVTGPSGGGKSTLMAALAGEMPVEQGRVLLNGQDMRGADGSRLDAPVGALAQAPRLLAGTVAENISAFAEADMDEITAAARLIGADADIRGLPQGYETAVGPGGREVPAGLTQRIALARAVFRRPRLLLLDEPYSHLDHAGVETLIAALNDLRADGALVIIVSQRPSVLAHCSRVLLVDGGRARMVDRKKTAPLRLLSNKDQGDNAADASSETPAEVVAEAPPRKPRRRKGARK